jgi:hypothetical protein
LKFINEATAFKILIEGRGVLLSITTKRRAFYFFLSSRYVGARVAPTTDPYPGIVELCDYDLYRILDRWNELYRIKIMNQTGTVR